MNDPLTSDNFLLYAAQHYDNPQCHSTDEFMEDLKRLKYIKKLITRYVEGDELKERLVLNHLIVLYNVFGAEHLPRMLYLKMKGYYKYIIPFLILMGVLPRKLYNIDDEEVIDLDVIQMDYNIVNKLRKI